MLKNLFHGVKKRSALLSCNERLSYNSCRTYVQVYTGLYIDSSSDQTSFFISAGPIPARPALFNT
ncbi:MAG: hypothetical protein WAU40_15385, partial [Nitrospira sp.]